MIENKSKSIFARHMARRKNRQKFYEQPAIAPISPLALLLFTLAADDIICNDGRNIARIATLIKPTSNP